MTQPGAVVAAFHRRAVSAGLVATVAVLAPVLSGCDGSAARPATVDARPGDAGADPTRVPGSGGTWGSGTAPAGGTASPAGYAFAGSRGGMLFVLNGSDVAHLDPARSYVTDSLDLGRLLYRTLTTFRGGPGQAGEQVVPDLATDTGEPSDGGRTWTFHLKPGLRYEDGTAITAADVKYGAERGFAPELTDGPGYLRSLLVGAAGYRGPYLAHAGIAGIATPDAHTVVFHFVHPFADFDRAATLPVVSPVPAARDTRARYDDRPFSSGPYKIQSYDRGRRLVLVRNTFWDPGSEPAVRAYPDTVVVSESLSFDEIDRRLVADRGDDRAAVQLSAPVLPADVAGVLAHAADRAVTGTDGSASWAAMDMASAPTDNLLVRQAIEYAWNHQTYLAALGGPTSGVVSHGILPPSLPSYRDVDLYPTPGGTGDVARARRLLAQAGHPHGVTVTYEPGTALGRLRIGESVRVALARAGITVRVLPVVKGYVDVVHTPSQSPNLAGTGWFPDWPSGSGVIPAVFTCAAITPTDNQNVSQLCNPAVDAASAAALAEPDRARADADWAALAERVMRQAPVVPTVYGKVVTLHGSQVRNADAALAFGGAVDLANVAVR